MLYRRYFQRHITCHIASSAIIFCRRYYAAAMPRRFLSPLRHLCCRRDNISRRYVSPPCCRYFSPSRRRFAIYFTYEHA